MRTNLFFLGAGFSADAGLPVSNSFMNSMRNAGKNYFLEKTPPSLNVPIREFLGYQDGKKEIFDSALISNIEFWLSLVSAKSLGGISNRGFTKLQMQVAISQTIEHCVSGLSPENENYVDSFVNKFGKNSTVITFNYDDLVERACDRNDMRYRYGFKIHGFDSKFTVYFHNRKFDPDENPSSFPIFKLHGSYNWIVKNNTNNIFVVSDMNGFFRDSCFWEQDWTGYGFVIEPPTIDKIYAAPVLSQVWGVSYDALTTAENIVVIGYSFPENDGYVKYLLMAALAENEQLKSFIVVDPYCDDLYKSRIKWLINLLERKGIQIQFCKKTARSWVEANSAR